MNRITVLTAGVIALFAIAFSPCARAQDLYVSFSGGGDIRSGAINNVTVLNSNGAIINSFGDSNQSTPEGLVFDSAGSLYVADSAGQIKKFTSSGVLLSTITNSNVVYPFGLAIDRNGNLYAANAGNDSIAVFNSSGVFLKNITSSGNLAFPYGIAFDSAGNLYASNYNGAAGVTEFDSNGVFVKNVGTNKVVGPTGLAFDSAGNLYVASTRGNAISVFDSNGVFQKLITGGNMSAPVGLAFDSSGNLYAANQGNSGKISEFNSNGDFVRTLASGLYNPHFLAFGPRAAVTGTPEPGTWAFLTSLGIAGLSIYRRRRTKTSIER